MKIRYLTFLAALAFAMGMFLNPSSGWADPPDRKKADPTPTCGDGKVNQSSEECDDGTDGSPTCDKTCKKIAPAPAEEAHLKRLEVDEGHVRVLKVDEVQLGKPLVATAPTLQTPDLTLRIPSYSYGILVMPRYTIGLESPVPNLLQLDLGIIWRDIPSHCGFRLAVSPGAFWFPGDMNGESKAGFAISGTPAFLVGWSRGGFYLGPQLNYLGEGYRDQLMVDIVLRGYFLFNGDKDSNTGIIDFGISVPALRPHNMVGQEDSFHTVVASIGVGWFTRPNPLPADPPEPAHVPVCGDGVKEGTEQCDHGSAGSSTCSPACKQIKK